MKVRFTKPERVDTSRDRGIRVPYASAKRNLPRWRWYLILLVVSSPLLYFVSKFMYGATFVAAPGVVRIEQIAVRATVHGQVEEIVASPHDEVDAGDILLVLANKELRSKADELRSQLAKLSDLDQPTAAAGSQTANSEQQLALAKRNAALKQERLNRIQDLVNAGAATEGELAAAQNDYQAALARTADLYQQRAAQDQRNTSGDSLQAHQITLESELALVEEQLQALVIRAPKSGRILEIPVNEGEQMDVGGKLAMLAPVDGKLYVNAYIPPAHSDYAESGLPAQVVLPGGNSLEAKVTDVPEVATRVPSAHSAFFGSRDLGVLVRMELIQTAGIHKRPFSDGLPVEVRFRSLGGKSFTDQMSAKLRDYWNGIMSAIS